MIFLYLCSGEATLLILPAPFYDCKSNNFFAKTIVIDNKYCDIFAQLRLFNGFVYF